VLDKLRVLHGLQIQSCDYDQLIHDCEIHRDSQHGEQSNDGGFLTVQANSLVHDFIPKMSKATEMFQRHQLKGFLCTNRLYEMDMNLMSPITRAVDEKCYNTVKLLVKFLKDFVTASNDKELIRDHAPIFYGAVKQLIHLQLIDLEEFLNPDGVGEDVGCELFQQTLVQKFLPQFSESG